MNDGAAMDQGGTTSGEVLTTTLNRRWLIKMSIFIAALIGLGLWGTWDALVAYPQRGKLYAEYMKRDYLEQADKDNLILNASVEDPATEHKSLKAKSSTLSPVEEARLRWLENLRLVSNLSAATEENKREMAKAPGERSDTQTWFKDPKATFTALKTSLASTTKPKPLSAYDIPSQYLFMLVGFGGALWMLFFLVRAARVKYRYEPATHALTLPNGKRLLPSEIAEVDRRLWHKFFVFLKPSDGSSEVKLDLLRYTPLEDWFLEIEQRTPNYKPEETPAPEAATSNQA